jgi:hypothetical protein
MNWLTSTLMLLFPTQPASHSTPNYLIVAQQVSGYVRSEDAFENLCGLLENGQLEGVLKKNRTPQGPWTTSEQIHEVIAPEEKTKVIELLKQAKSGPFSRGPATCDGGTLQIFGRISPDAPYPVVNSPDCAPTTVNSSTAAPELEKWVFAHCKFVP